MSRVLLWFALPMMIAMLGLVVVAGQFRSTTQAVGDTAVAAAERVWLEPVRTLAGITGRSVLECPAGSCIILHYPPLHVDLGDLRGFLEESAQTTDEVAEIYSDPANRWSWAETAYRTNNTFNCCTYAVGDVVGLTTDDWVAPSASGDTYYTVPMQIILDSYFDQIRTYRDPSNGWEEVVLDTHLREEDVLCCVSTEGRRPDFAHAGRICKKNGTNWLLSKFGSGPIVRSTLRKVASEYDGLFDQIWVYRAKKSMADPSRH